MKVIITKFCVPYPEYFEHNTNEYETYIAPHFDYLNIHIYLNVIFTSKKNILEIKKSLKKKKGVLQKIKPEKDFDGITSFKEIRNEFKNMDLIFPELKIEFREGECTGYSYSISKNILIIFIKSNVIPNSKDGFFL